MRQAVDAHPRLGPAVPVFVKRGCTEFEVRRGPSDRYTFAEETREIERRIRPLFQIGEVQPETQAQRQQTFAHWIRTAYGLGDDTYLDFTGGRRLYPAPVRYPLEENVAG